MFRDNTRKYSVFELDLVLFHETSIWKIDISLKLFGIFENGLKSPRVNTLDILFIVPFDHQAAHIYKYMGLNIPYILGVFGLKNMFYFTKT